MNTKKLFECYSRLLIDNHITDQKPEYMQQFSPEDYVRMVKKSGVESAMVYACCHNGNCYYPTRCGHMHAGLKGRDIFGETVKLLRENNILPVAYCTVNYHNDCARRFPGARLVDTRGRSREGRYHFTCPNQPEAVSFYKEQIREIAEYDVLAGLFIDMTFWPSVCLCDKCREKFGEPLPEVIDWSDPRWIRFQRFRERSMAEFAAELTAEAKKSRPDISVVHQFSPVLHGWLLGQSAGIAGASDYASGDFYGGKLQQRLGVKVFDSFTQTPPYEFMASRCVSLRDHTSSKSPDELYLSALTTLANGGAYFLIDAIDPSGKLRPGFYETLSRLNTQLTPFREKIASGKFRLSARTGVFFSIAACVDRELDGTPLAAYDAQSNNMKARENAVLDEVLGTAEILCQMHVPYRIITGMDQLEGLDTLIINNAAFMTAGECEAVRSFVRSGGTLIATGRTSLTDMEGCSSGNFQLADIFGVDFTGKYSDQITYLGEDELSCTGAAPLVLPGKETETGAYLTFPDFPFHDPDHYASIHSDPPGAVPSPYAGIAINRTGKGKCVYLAVSVLKQRQWSQQEFCKKLLRPYLVSPLAGSQNLPGSTELTLLKGTVPGEQLLCLVNYQDELPPIPLKEIVLTLELPQLPCEIIRISDGQRIDFSQEGNRLTFTIPEITYGEFYLLKTRS